MNPFNAIFASLLALALVSPTGALAEDPPKLTLITNVNIFDGVNDGLAEGMSVLIEGNLIKTISADAIEADGATVIDGGGRTLMPGLIDMHSHLGTAEGLADGRDEWDAYAIGAIAAHNLVLFLEQGFTTTRGAGGPDLGLAKAVKAGRIPGPRFYPSGPWLSQTAGHADLGYWTDTVDFRDYSELTETSHVVDGRDEILKAVRYNLRRGATQIKLMDRI
jgi:imidazolonepropionase-like amidohydrolase